MKLATKLAFAVVLIMVTVFSLRAYDSAQREIARARADLREGHFIIARALRPAILEVWRLEGKKRALEVLGYADERIQRARKVRIEWVPLDPPSAHHLQLIGPAEVDNMKRQVDATVVRIDQGQLRTYIPLVRQDRLEGALAISEPLTPHEERSKTEVRAVLVRSGLGAAVSIAAVSAFGFLLVGRPMRRLSEMAKRIGTGDLEARLDLRQRDEIGQLAGEMNQMCSRLKSANERVQEETAARIGALEQLRHVDRLRTVGTLASGIAHELGTPLNVVSGRAKMIATGESAGDSALEGARIIVDQVDRITRIIRQLLDFARRRTPDRGRHALTPVVEQTLNLLRPMAGKRQVDLVLEADDPPVHADVDVGQMQQALTNLVVNGLQAMTAGGRLCVQISRGRVDPPVGIGGPTVDCAVLTVADQGVGIAPELVSRVFEPFFTTKDVGEGTGLGLSVAYGIARDHGGWITVDSKIGRGSRFSLYVPVVRPVEVAA
jgi:two-component system, NtrC family, sensor kinase